MRALNREVFQTVGKELTTELRDLYAELRSEAPTEELIAAHRSEEEVAGEIGADALIYQDLDALKDAVRRANPKLKNFETSCFDGHYITGDITSDYLRDIEIRRDATRDSGDDAESAQLDLNLAA